eukprot:CAMPEP_0176135816 /NCGR_PEP_ID=MMETSP0120_2-20121206/68907_1 /TAXON_ID=160619 /ORGANISM="Kryptoperidinium foliaceum, Strain CCMP 1326" /LENGTH=157 /DNA_ID=CAMNT_0017471547 /DNA_START=261 /DNA_END=731 /DNA_ORIENTATION=+
MESLAAAEERCRDVAHNRFQLNARAVVHPIPDDLEVATDHDVRREPGATTRGAMSNRNSPVLLLRRPLDLVHIMRAPINEPGALVEKSFSATFIKRSPQARRRLSNPTAVISLSRLASTILTRCLHTSANCKICRHESGSFDVRRLRHPMLNCNLPL